SIPTKNYYNRLYLQSVLELITLLHKNKCYDKIIEVCEKAFLIEPWEEELHLKFIEALLEKGKTRQALAHYNYITAALYNELGIKPSAALQKIYNLIKKGWQSAPLDPKSIQKNLAKNYAGTGSYYCDPELFQEVLKLEQLRNERTGQQSSLALLSLTAKEFNNISSHTQLEAMNKIQSILLKNLRKGDVFTRWNDFQFLVILSNTNLNQSHVPLQRISRNFKKDRPTSNIALQESVQSILPLQLPV
ncbi:MAG: diguanylate cyclase, partial [Firmicutes bacterium]|nr:diguanylate cyclase [Bacillota bacterium]